MNAMSPTAGARVTVLRIGRALGRLERLSAEPSRGARPPAPGAWSRSLAAMTAYLLLADSKARGRFARALVSRLQRSSHPAGLVHLALTAALVLRGSATGVAEELIGALARHRGELGRAGVAPIATAEARVFVLSGEQIERIFSNGVRDIEAVASQIESASAVTPKGMQVATQLAYAISLLRDAARWAPAIARHLGGSRFELRDGRAIATGQIAAAIAELFPDRWSAAGSGARLAVARGTTLSLWTANVGATARMIDARSSASRALTAGAPPTGSGVDVASSTDGFGAFVGPNGPNVFEESVLSGAGSDDPNAWQSVTKLTDYSTGDVYTFTTYNNGNTSSEVIDGTGVTRATTSSDSATGMTTVNYYDSNGNLISSTTYDSAGNIVSSTGASYGGNGYFIQYDESGNAISGYYISTDPSTGTQTTSYFNNQTGEIDVTQKNAAGNQTFSSVTTVDSDNGTVTTTMTYSDGSTTVSQTDPNTGQTTVTEYDASGQQTSTTVYDASGQPVTPPDDGDDEGDGDEYIPADFEDYNRGDARGGRLDLGVSGGDPVDMPQTGGGSSLNWSLVSPGEGPMTGDLAPSEGGSVLDYNRLSDPSSDPNPEGNGGGDAVFRPPTGGWVAFPATASQAQVGHASVGVQGGAISVSGALAP